MDLIDAAQRLKSEGREEWVPERICRAAFISLLNFSWVLVMSLKVENSCISTYGRLFSDNTEV
jgi:hypothetical protein